MENWLNVKYRISWKICPELDQMSSNRLINCNNKLSLNNKQKCKILLKFYPLKYSLQLRIDTIYGFSNDIMNVEERFQHELSAYIWIYKRKILLLRYDVRHVIWITYYNLQTDKIIATLNGFC